MNRSKIGFLSGVSFSLLAGWYLFPALLYKSEPQPIQFNHKIHVESSGMTCTDCHATDSEGYFQGIPVIAKCEECHSAPMGETPDEKILVEDYITPHKEIPWHVYSRQPDNAYFSHATHVTLGKMQCTDCHGTQGESEQLRIYQVNRISGYSRDIWGENISGFNEPPGEGMKMEKCVTCHAKQNRKDGCIACHK